MNGWRATAFVMALLVASCTPAFDVFLTGNVQDGGTSEGSGTDGGSPDGGALCGGKMCAVNAVCFRNACQCRLGYSGNGLTCMANSVCGGTRCDAHATCENGTCTCTTGYTGSGTTCSPVNPCATDNGGCDSNATCAAISGIAKCTCKQGYTGDGMTCSPSASGTPSSQTSTVVANPGSLWADGVTASTLNVTVKDAGGQAVSGAAVVLEATGPARLLAPLSGVTDAHGLFVSHLTSTQPGHVTVTAHLGAVTLSTQLTFINPACTITGFTQAPGSPLGGSLGLGMQPNALAAGDFNEDGRLDLVVGSNDGTLTTLLRNSGGGFAKGSSIQPFWNTVNWLTIADLNNDGHLDMALVDFGDSAMDVLFGDGAGGFPNRNIPIMANQAQGIDVVVAADFNRDGNMDLAATVANQGGGEVTVLLGDGHGNFSAESPISEGMGPGAMVTGDFNGDGIADLAFGNGDDTISVLLGDGAGGFQDAPESPFFAGVNASSIAAGDFNGDGKLDLAAANSTMGPGTVSIFLGNGGGKFSDASGSPFATGAAPQSLVAGDFNGDGRIDLAVSCAGTNASAAGTVDVLLGDGTGAFARATGAPVAVGASPEGLVTGDFNGDGTLDLAVANQNSDSVSVLLTERTGCQ